MYACYLGQNDLLVSKWAPDNPIARSFELAMPQYLDDNAPRFGRKRAKDLKVYHVRKGLCGPDLISKYIWHLDSHYSRYKFLGTNGQLKNDAKNHPYPSLVAAQNLLLDAFDLPYSLNKCKRWTIMEIGRKSISSVQNRSIGLRVSICCHQVGREVSMRYNNPESNTGYSYDSDMVSEFHSSNDGSELHLKGRNMKFVDVYRRKEVARRKKKRRYYRQKFPLLKLQGWVPEKEQDMIDFEQRSTHVVFKQQSFSASFRLINMDDGKNPKEANRWYQEMRSRTAERKQRKNERKQKKHKKFVRTSSRRFADRTAETKKTPNNRCRFMKSYEHDDSVIELEEAVTFQLMLDGVAELSEHEEECERKPWKLALSDFNISGFKKKRKYSKKKVGFQTENFQRSVKS
ncbi:unnamed protein product [Toxocara canis]|uniref:PH domain-containing protein n=1 Tax=Toxocara canis TaxID=6265 RepID=A0A183UVD3_TOXCA|nr:unnamed protein product [Toxocara canis]